MFFKRKKKKPSDDIINAEQKPLPEEQSAEAAQPEAQQAEQLQTHPASQESSSQEAPSQEAVEPEPEPQQAEPEAEQPAKLSFFQRIKKGLSRTSGSLSSGLANLLLGKKEIDDELLEEIETLLLTSDIGIDATSEIIDDLTTSIDRKQLTDGDAVYASLQQHLAKLLAPVEQPLQIDASKSPYVILVVGVNGVGKTTTIGKLAKHLMNSGQKVVLAAGDTFRAAAVEQLQAWGERNQVPVIAQHTGADSASVIFDAMQAARSRGADVVIADTAGRLHNKSNLMEELSKVKRVMGKLDESAPHEVLLVLDAGTGQNALNQAEQFNQSVGITGLVLTKLDGTARGGIIFALSKRFNIPVRFIGVGETVDDLQPFAAKAFIDALFDQSH